MWRRPFSIDGHLWFVRCCIPNKRQTWWRLWHLVVCLLDRRWGEGDKRRRWYVRWCSSSPGKDEVLRLSFWWRRMGMPVGSWTGGFFLRQGFHLGSLRWLFVHQGTEGIPFWSLGQRHHQDWFCGHRVGKEGRGQWLLLRIRKWMRNILREVWVWIWISWLLLWVLWP